MNAITTWLRKFVATMRHARTIASHTYTCSSCGRTIISQKPPEKVDGKIMCKECLNKRT